MMSFCKKSVHSFLGLTTNTAMNFDANRNYTDTPPSCTCPFQGVSHVAATTTTTMAGGLGLITATGDVQKTPNVLESATVKSPSPPPSSSSPAKKDPRGIGFIDDIGGGVDGLMSCTESLGFESYDERRADDEIDMCSTSTSTSFKLNKWRKGGGGERRAAKKFPPPISSLNHNGSPNFFLRPVRKDGRLELTEVRIDRPEILRASRQDGRLRLHLVSHEEDEESQEQEALLEEEHDEEEEMENVKENIEEKRVEQWSFPAKGEGFRRCLELVAHHHHHQPGGHHHNLHVWSQHCVK